MNKKPPHGWNENHWIYYCADGIHDSFWKTVVTSPQWVDWEADVAKRFYARHTGSPVENVWDTNECRESGWISYEHFQAFLEFVKGVGKNGETK